MLFLGNSLEATVEVASGDKMECASTVPAVNLKISPVEREDRVDPVTLAHTDQRGVREVHGQVPVLPASKGAREGHPRR